MRWDGAFCEDSATCNTPSETSMQWIKRLPSAASQRWLVMPAALMQDGNSIVSGSVTVQYRTQEDRPGIELGSAQYKAGV